MDYYKFYKDKHRKEYTFSPAAFEGGWALGGIEAKELFELIANQLHIPFYDECCEDEQQLTVRYDVDSNTLEAYDPTTKDFKTIILNNGTLGPQGIQGIQGIQGEIGPQGIQGEPGIDGGGSSYELNLTTTGNSGAATYDVNTDTLNIPIYTDGVQSVIAGTNVTIDNTDPLNPIVSATGSGGGALTRFGIEDNVGVQNREINMQGYPLSISSGQTNLKIYTQDNRFVSGLNDGIYTGSHTGAFADTYYLYITSTGSVDKFKWGQFSTTIESPEIEITGNPQLLSDGIYITFSSVTGHTLNSEWDYIITEQGENQNLFLVKNNSNNIFKLNNNGTVELSQYGKGVITGTPSKNLSINNAGNVIETPNPVLSVTGSAVNNTDPLNPIILAGRYGIEDNVGGVNRGINMGFLSTTIINSGEYKILASQSSNPSQLVGRLDINSDVNGGYASIGGQNATSNANVVIIPGKIELQTSTTGIGQLILSTPSTASGNYFIPLSVNNQFADAAGNITIATGGGASDPFWIEVTRTQADTLITSSTLVKGATYKITGVHPSLYNDGTNSGTTIYLRAIENNTFSVDGTGEFYNPKYNAASQDYDVWNAYSTAVALNTNFTGTLNAGETITANNGATAYLYGFGYNIIYFKVLTGDWTTATSITGNTSGATAPISSPNIKAYAAAAKVAYGGYMWSNNLGVIGTSLNVLQLSSDWSKIPFDTINYNRVYDAISYDYANDKIFARKDNQGNTVSSGIADIVYFNTTKSLLGTPISVFGWGNPMVLRNIVSNSYLETVNATKILYTGNDLKNLSIMAGNIGFAVSSYYRNSLSYESEIRNNSMFENGEIYGNILNAVSTINSNIGANAIYIYRNKLDDSCTINSNQLRRSAINGNILKANSSINTNLSNENTAAIVRNTLMLGNINGNILKGIYVQAVGSDRAFINSNTVYQGQINNNILTVTYNNRTLSINNNTVTGDLAADSSIRTGAINNCKITSPYYNNISLESGAYIRDNRINISQLLNTDVRGYYASIVNNDVNDYVWDFATVPNYIGVKLAYLSSKKIEVTISKVFDGTVTSGVIGSVKIPTINVPVGFFVDKLLIDVGAGLTASAGAILNMGIDIDVPQAALNDTTGLVTTLNSAGITKVNNSTFTKNTNVRNISMEVKGADITAGTATFKIYLSKLS